MDRNNFFQGLVGRGCVALRKESVDRNNAVQVVIIIVNASLSARRAWIEMQVFNRIAKPFRVALRKESVDRNLQKLAEAIKPSVALRKESVDRNQAADISVKREASRSPQGERG